MVPVGVLIVSINQEEKMSNTETWRGAWHTRSSKEWVDQEKAQHDNIRYYWQCAWILARNQLPERGGITELCHRLGYKTHSTSGVAYTRKDGTVGHHNYAHNTYFVNMRRGSRPKAPGMAKALLLMAGMDECLPCLTDDARGWALNELELTM